MIKIIQLILKKKIMHYLRYASFMAGDVDDGPIKLLYFDGVLVNV